jgi:hypothetical protein
MLARGRCIPDAVASSSKTHENRTTAVDVLSPLGDTSSLTLTTGNDATRP